VAVPAREWERRRRKSRGAGYRNRHHDRRRSRAVGRPAATRAGGVQLLWAKGWRLVWV
jgi:hypothetical protein